jgi:putative hydrolase of the HAD superfamily
MAKLKAVIFDWGGTLTPWHNIDLKDLWSVAARIFAPDKSDQFAEALLAAESDFWHRSAISGGDHSTRLQDLVQTAGINSGVNVEYAIDHSAMGAYLEAWTPHTFAHQEAASVLKQLRALGLQIGLLSNTHWPREWHERILDRDSILSLIDERVYTSELAHTKPHREAFLAILGKLGVEASEAAMVGDRPIDDIAGARAIGMRAVLVPNSDVPTGNVEPNAKINTLADLVPIIKEWVSGS